MRSVKAHAKAVAGYAPAGLVLMAFMVIPMVIIATYSFMEANPYGGVRPVFSAEAYQKLLFERNWDDELEFNAAYIWIALRSLRIALVAVLASLIVGLPVAWYIATRPAGQRDVLLLLVTVPFWTNLLVRTYAWVLVLRDTGLVNEALAASGVTDTPVTLLYTEGAIVLGLIYTYVPFMILPIYAALERVDARLIEAARDLHASRWGAIRLVVLPLAAPGIVAGCILVFIPSLGAFLAPDLLGGGKNLMLGSLVQLQFSSARNWPFGSAIALVMLALTILALLAYAMNARRSGAGMVH